MTARRHLGRWALAALPLALLAMAEGGLRLAGRGGYPPLFRAVGAVDGRRLVEYDWRGAESYFYQGRFGRGSGYQQSFFMPKDASTVRIMLLGESAIKGTPQPITFSAGAFLKAMLEDLWPGREVEILNLGVTAVASFPVWDILRQALRYEPDLVIVYTGNNEFYGAYGVASQHFAGSHPLVLRATRALHGLALVQAVMQRLAAGGAAPGGPASSPAAAVPATLMDAMMRRQELAPNSRLRAAAARTLDWHVRDMAARCRALGIPVLVCSLACNERDLAPMGTGADARAAFARGAFQRALDLDTRPWRPTSGQQAALARAAVDAGAIFCDVRAAFRAASPGGAIGWELMDDHVHPSLAGQALLARTWAAALTNAPAAVRVDPQAWAALPGDAAYGARLGTNVYDAIGVAMGMMALFRAPFLLESNPRAYARWAARVPELGRALPPEVAGAFDRMLRAYAQSDGRVPVAGLAGQALAQIGRVAEAEPLLALACQATPPYSTLHRQFVYERYVCRRQARGGLDADACDAIGAEIRAGEVLTRYGGDPSGRNAQFVAKLRALMDIPDAASH